MNSPATTNGGRLTPTSTIARLAKSRMPPLRNAAVTPTALPMISAIQIETSPSDIDTGSSASKDVVDRPSLIRQAGPKIPVPQYLPRIISQKFFPALGVESRLEVGLGRLAQRPLGVFIRRSRRHPHQCKRDDIDHRQNQRQLSDSPCDESGHWDRSTCTELNISIAFAAKGIPFTFGRKRYAFT